MFCHEVPVVVGGCFERQLPVALHRTLSQHRELATMRTPSMPKKETGLYIAFLHRARARQTRPCQPVSLVGLPSSAHPCSTKTRPGLSFQITSGGDRQNQRPIYQDGPLYRSVTKAHSTTDPRSTHPSLLENIRRQSPATQPK
jgi:hypothetical protein